jgi:hypothetical protein
VGQNNTNNVLVASDATSFGDGWTELEWQGDDAHAGGVGGTVEDTANKTDGSLLVWNEDQGRMIWQFDSEGTIGGHRYFYYYDPTGSSSAVELSDIAESGSASDLASGSGLASGSASDLPSLIFAIDAIISSIIC